MATFNSDLAQVDSTSYVTVADADDYFTSRLGSTEWDTASAGDKQNSLMMATRDIDKNRFLGSKWRFDQSLKWPRIFNKDTVARFRTGSRTLGMWFDTITQFINSAADDTHFIINSLIETGELPGNRPANYWALGQVEVVAGTAVGDIRRVSASSRITGEITVGSAFSSTLDTTSKVILTFKIPQSLVEATCEQALFKLRNADNKRSSLISQGVKKITVGNTTEEYATTQPETIATEAKERLKTLITKTGWIT